MDITSDKVSFIARTFRNQKLLFVKYISCQAIGSFSFGMNIGMKRWFDK